MARENFLWGAPRIHGELLMLGFKVSQATVSRYLSNLTPTSGPVVANVQNLPKTAFAIGLPSRRCAALDLSRMANLGEQLWQHNDQGKTATIRLITLQYTVPCESNVKCKHFRLRVPKTQSGVT